MAGRLNVQTESTKLSASILIPIFRRGAETAKFRDNKEKNAKMKEVRRVTLKRGLLGALICTPEMSSSTVYQKLIFREPKIQSIINKEKTLLLREH